MSQLFRRNGYYATRIGKIYHYNVPKHIGTGGHDDPYSWDRTINPTGRDKDDAHLIFSLRKGSYGGTLSWLAADGTDAEQTDGVGAAEAIRLLEEYGENRKRFYLAVGLYRPHTPYVAPRKYFDTYPAEDIVVPSVPDNYYETIPAPAEMVDFYPTLAELAGLKAPQYIKGVSLVTVLRNISARPRTSALTQYAEGYSIRTAQFRYTEWGQNGVKGRELYDHFIDAQELNNLARVESHQSTIDFHSPVTSEQR